MRRRILVVDDDLVIRRLIRSVLEEEGYAVEVAENAATAQCCLKTNNPDLVILDPFLPGVDEPDDVGFWRRHSCASGLPVVVISSAPHAAQRARQIRARAFLPKPFELDVLIRVVADCLQQADRDLTEGRHPDGQNYIGWQPS